MANILVTGSADGLGKMAAQLLANDGHDVVLHARNEERANVARLETPQAKHVVIGDLARIKEMRDVAEQVNAIGPMDAVIHNAAIGYQEPRRVETEDGLNQVFAINSLAPYVLTALIGKPKRLIYLSSGLHHSADTELDDIDWTERRWNGTAAYSESKFHDVLMAFAVARLYPHIYSNALEPGWVATKMGGRSAPDDLNQGFRTQAWLAVSEDAAATVSGEYFFHLKPKNVNPAARSIERQNKFLAYCEKITGLKI